MNNAARYALRFETADGTLEEPYHFTGNKADAIKFARRAAKDVRGADIVRVHVDDAHKDIGVKSFTTSFFKPQE